MFNAKLLLAGYAQLSTYPPDIKYVDLFTEFQKEARAANNGLWGYEHTAEPTAGQAPSAEAGKIKGNINNKGEKIYRVPGGAYYDQTVPEEWFTSEEQAQAAGYRKSKR